MTCIEEHAHQGEFAGSERVLVHELNNVLTIVAGSARVLQMQLAGLAVPPEVVRRVNVVFDYAERAMNIIKSMREGKRKKLVINPSVYLNGVRDFIEIVAGPNIRCGFHVDCSDGICVSPADLDEIVMNLVKNSIEAMDGEGRVDISLMTEDISSAVCSTCKEVFFGRHVVVEVRDTGPGIGEDIIDRVFENFFTTKGSGRGLGLYIVRMKAHAAGGHVSVRSSSSGTAFRVYFPVAQPQQCEAPGGAPALKRNVLVFSPNPDFADAVRSYLGRIGLRFVGNEHDAVDLVIYDVNEDARDLRKLLDRYPSARILCLTNHRVGYHSAGRVRFVEKPLTEGDFIWLVSNIFGEQP